MGREILFILKHDVLHMLRARETIMWVFVMPVVFFYFIGTITGGMGSQGPRQDAIAVRVEPGAGFLVEPLLRQLEARDYRIQRVDSDSALARWRRRLIVPAGFTDSVLAGHPVKVKLVRRASGLGSDYDTIRVGRAVYTLLADVIVSSEAGQAPTPEALARLDSMPRALTLNVHRAGHRKHIPQGYEQAIPGIMTMFILIVMTTSGAVLLVVERRQGLLRRLASTPVRRSSVVTGKWGGRLTLGIVQIVFGMLVGTLVFKMDWGPDAGVVVLVLLVYAAVVALLGLWLGNIARVEGQAVGLGVLASNVLAALGGCWWPIEITPAWMQKMQLFLPTGWAMDALHKLISFEAGPQSVVPHLAGMALLAAVLLAFTSRTLRYT